MLSKLILSQRCLPHPNASKPNEYIKESSIEAVSKMPSNKMTLDEWIKFYSKTRRSGTTISAIEGIVINWVSPLVSSIQNILFFFGCQFKSTS